MKRVNYPLRKLMHLFCGLEAVDEWGLGLPSPCPLPRERGSGSRKFGVSVEFGRPTEKIWDTFSHIRASIVWDGEDASLLLLPVPCVRNDWGGRAGLIGG